MNLGDTLITIFVMLLITCIFFIFPLMITANQNDSATQVTLQTSMTDFVNEICNTGKITRENYDKFILTKRKEFGVRNPRYYEIFYFLSCSFSQHPPYIFKSK